MENKYLEVAFEAAFEAGHLLMSYLGKLNTDQIRRKGERDLVTKADCEAEKCVVEKIKKHFPEHNILGEEDTYKESDSPYKWFIDPLDGTTNFTRQLPFFCISIAMGFEEEIQIAVVYAPFLNQLFFASKGEGAYCSDSKLQNRTCLKVSEMNDFSEALMSTGFAYKRKLPSEKTREVDQLFYNILNNTHGIRRCGSAALDLCYVARGTFDGFWELGLNPYDVAAGSLIVQEAGGIVTDWQGKKDYIYGQNILACNEKLYDLFAKYFLEIHNFMG